MKSNIILEIEYNCTKLLPLGPTMNPDGSVPCWGVNSVTKIEGDCENPFLREWILAVSWGCHPIKEGVHKYPFGEFVVSAVDPVGSRRGGSISPSYAVAEVGRKRIRIEASIRNKRYSPKRNYSVWGPCSEGMVRFSKQPMTWAEACIAIQKYNNLGCYEQIEIRKI